MIVSLPSRNELLTWISQLTNTNVEKLQQLSDGIAFCQIFDKMHPKMINMTKLKKDPKIPTEKEKNFRILLNAVNQLGLCVAINIIELSHGKVTAILQLLQWFYKQYKNPIGKHVGQERDQKFPQPRMIKTYVGNLIDRQKSFQKEIKVARSELSSSRRSLDTKLIQKNVFETEKSRSVRSKTVRQSQHKSINEKKQNLSKVKSIKFDQQKFEDKCSLKKESMKKQLSEKVDKMSQKKSQVKSQILSEKDERKVLQVLSKALNAQKPKLQNTLIRVTQAVLEGNPELERKIRMIVEDQSEKKQAHLRSEFSPDHQVRNILDSIRSTSEICQIDTLDEIPPENSQLIASSLKEPEQIHEENMLNSIVRLPFQISTKKQFQQDKKETVKKSTTKVVQSNPSLVKSFKVNQISGKKERELEIQPQLQETDQINQNLLQNSISKEPKKCFLFNPHEKVEKSINPQTYVTEKKVEISKENKIQENRRQVQSENFTTSQSKDDKSIWKHNQSFGPNQNTKS